MTGRVGGMVRGAATALTSLVLAHNLIFLAGYGAHHYASAMAGTGHDQQWVIAALLTVSLGISLLAGAAWRLHRLRRQAQAIGARQLSTEPGAAEFVRLWLRWWLALVLVTALLFVLEENVELARVAAPLRGFGVLASGTYPHAVLIIAAVSLVVSLVATLLGWKLRLLEARLQAAETTGGPAFVPAFIQSDPFDRRLGSILGRRLAVRAPPLESIG